MINNLQNWLFENWKQICKKQKIKEFNTMIFLKMNWLEWMKENKNICMNFLNCYY